MCIMGVTNIQYRTCSSRCILNICLNVAEVVLFLQKVSQGRKRSFEPVTQVPPRTCKCMNHILDIHTVFASVRGSVMYWYQHHLIGTWFQILHVKAEWSSKSMFGGSSRPIGMEYNQQHWGSSSIYNTHIDAPCQNRLCSRAQAHWAFPQPKWGIHNNKIPNVHQLNTHAVSSKAEAAWVLLQPSLAIQNSDGPTVYQRTHVIQCQLLQ